MPVVRASDSITQHACWTRWDCSLSYINLICRCSLSSCTEPADMLWLSVSHMNQEEVSSMGWNFRPSQRRIKILPGVRLNIGKKGISSVSISGGKWLRVSVNLSRRGIRFTHGLKGVGSVSKYRKFSKD